jgi:aspartyl-tRNA(Asn)/glutamyl-tRNA(Gln) amidotransferase subunit C
MIMFEISPDTVKRVAQVARLQLSESELQKFSKDLEAMLDAFKDLERLDTKGVKPSFQPIETKNVLRKDRVEPSLTQEQALSNTKNKEKGFFKGPKAV